MVLLNPYLPREKRREHGLRQSKPASTRSLAHAPLLSPLSMARRSASKEPIAAQCQQLTWYGHYQSLGHLKSQRRSHAPERFLCQPLSLAFTLSPIRGQRRSNGLRALRHAAFRAGGGLKPAQALKEVKAQRPSSPEEQSGSKEHCQPGSF